MLQSPSYLTADAVRALTQGARSPVRYELVWGDLLVTSAPRIVHQRLIGRLFRTLSSYCDAIGPVGAHGPLETMLSPADISWSDDTLVQPDLFVVPTREAASTHWGDVRTLLLVIEVLSPKTARQDRFAKRRLYQERGVPAVWLVDPDARQVEVWAPDDRRPRVATSAADDVVRWQPVPTVEPFVVQLPALFRSR